jgi:ADP-ribose pyrophosphatase
MDQAEEIHKGRVFRLMKERAVLPSGRVATYEVIRHPGSAAMLPVNAGGEILLLRQHRHAAGGEIWEIPAGTLNPGESPEDCARRELVEETGFSARKMELMSSITPVPGYSDEVIHLFFATGLTKAQQNLDPDEVIQVFPIPADKVFQMASEGEIRDAKTLCALFLASRRGLFTIKC